MSLLVSSMWGMASRHKLRAAMLHDVLRYKGADNDADLRSRVDTYFDHMAQYEHPGPEGVVMLSELPVALHSELMASVFEPFLTRIQLFTFCERSFIWRLCQRLRLSMFMPKDVIYGVGWVGHDMYIIWRGVVALTEPDGCMTALLCEGDHFGELGVMATNTPRPQRAVAMCAADIIMLSRGDLQDAMRDFPESAELVRSRAQVQLEDHEIGPAVWAASMATSHMQRQQQQELKQADNIGGSNGEGHDSAGPSSGALGQPSGKPAGDDARKLFTHGKDNDDHHSRKGGIGSSTPRSQGGNTCSATSRIRDQARISPWRQVLSVMSRAAARISAAPGMASVMRRKRLVQGQEKGVTATEAAVVNDVGAGGRISYNLPDGGGSGASGLAEPVAESTEDIFQLNLAHGTESVDPGNLEIPFDSNCQPSVSASSIDSLYAALTRTAAAPPAATIAFGGELSYPRNPHAMQHSTVDSALTSSTVQRRRAPRLPAENVQVRAPHDTVGRQIDESTGHPHVPGRGSNRQQRQRLEQQFLRSGIGMEWRFSSAAASHDAAGTACTVPGMSENAVVPFQLTSTRPVSPTTASSPVITQHPQPSSLIPTTLLSAFNSRDLVGLERARFSSQRPMDAGNSIVRYLSKRARQGAGMRATTAGSSTNPMGPAVWTPPHAMPGDSCTIAIGGGGRAPQVQQTAHAPMLSKQNSDMDRDIIRGSSGQQRIPTASQLLFVTPQPFLGHDPLGSLFDQQSLPTTNSPAALGHRWHCKSGRPSRSQLGASGTTSGASTVAAASFDSHGLIGGIGASTEDSTTRRLGQSLGRRSFRASAMRGSGRQLSHMTSEATGCCDVDGWLNDQQQPCRHPRCLMLELELARARRQLAATQAHLESILTEPLKDPTIQAVVRRENDAVVNAINTRMVEVLQKLLGKLLRVSVGAEDLSYQVVGVDDRLQRLEEEQSGGFGATAAAGAALTIGGSNLRRSPAVAAAAAAAAAGGDGSVLVDAPIQGPEVQRRNTVSALAGLIGPQSAAGGQMGVLLPLSTAAAASGSSASSFRPALGRQSSFKQNLHPRRSSTLGLRTFPSEELIIEAGVPGGGGSNAMVLEAGIAPAGTDTALLEATMNRAAGKNIRRRQSTRDLSVLTSNTIAAQQQQQQQQQQQSQPEQQEQQQLRQQQQARQSEPSSPSLLSRANSRAEGGGGGGARGAIRQRSGGDRVSPTSSCGSRRIPMNVPSAHPTSLGSTPSSGSEQGCCEAIRYAARDVVAATVGADVGIGVDIGVGVDAAAKEDSALSPRAAAEGGHKAAFWAPEILPPAALNEMISKTGKPRQHGGGRKSSSVSEPQDA
ncbi:hypothetical protein Vretifemale_19076 [Volvox reticuliferus]|nr:hypothetical protein Vretifemale_19076 [Volvox reticuliferus]